MYIIAAMSLAILVYNITDVFTKIIYRKYIIFESRLKIVQKQSLIDYNSQKKDRKERQKLSIEVPERLKKNLIMAGVHLRPEEFVVMWGIVIVFPALIASILNKGIIIIVMLVIAGIILPPAVIYTMRKNRMEKFDSQLGDALTVISNSLRAGFSFEQAIASMSEDLPDPIGAEFRKVVQELELGAKLEESMDKVAKRMQSKDMELMNTAVAIQRQVGGNLADILENIGKTIRDRIIIKKNIKALTAQGEISGKIIALLPIVLLVMISMVNPEYMEPMFNTTYGYVLLSVSVVLEILGYVMIKKLINIEM